MGTFFIFVMQQHIAHLRWDSSQGREKPASDITLYRNDPCMIEVYIASFLRRML